MKLFLEDAGSFKSKQLWAHTNAMGTEITLTDTLYEVQLKTIPQVNDPVSILSFIPCTAFRAKGTLASAEGKKQKPKTKQKKMDFR